VYCAVSYELRGDAIRIIPKSNTIITDQARFFYDSLLKSKRSLISGLHLNKIQNLRFSHSNVLSQQLKHFTIYYETMGRFQSHNAFQTIFSKVQEKSNTFIMADHYNQCTDFAVDLFNTSLMSILTFKAIVLWGTNIRLEAPIIAVSLKNHPKIYNLGDRSYFHSDISSISSYDAANVNIIKGKHSIWKQLMQYSSVFCIVGSDFSQNLNKTLNFSSIILQCFHQISKLHFTGLFSYIVLAPSLTSVNVDILIPKFPLRGFNYFSLYNAEAINVKRQHFVFYEGSYNDHGAHVSDAVQIGITPVDSQNYWYFQDGFLRKFNRIPFLNSYFESQIKQLFNKHNDACFTNVFPTMFLDVVFNKVDKWNMFRSTVYHRNSINLSVAAYRFSTMNGNKLLLNNIV